MDKFLFACFQMKLEVLFYHAKNGMACVKVVGLPYDSYFYFDAQELEGGRVAKHLEKTYGPLEKRLFEAFRHMGIGQ